MATTYNSKGPRTGFGRQASGYVQPGRVDKKPLVGYFDKEAHKAIKQLALDLDRKVQDLMAEAFHDLLRKFDRAAAAEQFKH